MDLTLELKDDQKLFLTSDTHFGHQNIIKYCARPWATADEMDQGLVERWNSVVRPSDFVLHLGDFVFKTKRKLSEIRQTLNGRIFLVQGNHDHHPAQYYRNAGFDFVFESESQCPLFEVSVNNQIITISHYPALSWKRSETPMFFGHIHSGPVKKVKYTENSWDVGVDRNDFYPVEYKQAIELARGRTV